MLRIKLVKSLIGQKPTNRATILSMGLGKIGSTVDLPNNDCTKGMIHKVKHMVTVEEVKSK